MISKTPCASSLCAASGDAARDGKALRDKMSVFPEGTTACRAPGSRPKAEPARNEAKNVKV
jgi:hypothetical protein